MALAKVGMKIVFENDWRERDEMVVVAERGKPHTITDDPKKVARFFYQWQATFP